MGSASRSANVARMLLVAGAAALGLSLPPAPHVMEKDFSRRENDREN